MVSLPHSSSRLKRARIEAGYRSARRFALELGIDDTTYRSHEAQPGASNHRAFNEEWAQRYAEALGVNWMWLLYGDDVAAMQGERAVASVAGVSEAQAAAALRPILEVYEIDTAAAMPIARLLLRAIRAANSLPNARLDESHFSIAGSIAVQEIGRDWRAPGKR
jgi:hypothetical protein